MTTPTKMLLLALPGDKPTWAAVGRIALRHAHLDYILRMTIKTLTGVAIREALDHTPFVASSELRKRIRKHAAARLGKGDAYRALEAYLDRAAEVTRRRNDLIHNIWAQELDGEAVQITDDHQRMPVPSVDTLRKLEDDIRHVTRELNQERLDGFLSAALAALGQSQNAD